MALPPIIAAYANPDHVGATSTVQLIVQTDPGLTVTCDTTPIGEPRAAQPLYDDGGHGDGAGGDGTYGFVTYVDAGTPIGDHPLPCSYTDGTDTAFFSIALTVIAACGDMAVQPPEQCDDGGAETGDGCDDTCTLELGWICLGSPSFCYTRCGDGRIVGPEECDDGAHHGGDGCSAGCVIEPGYQCAGEPSVCTHAELCGDGVIEGDEQCDDGNADDGDGCDATCTVETDWSCTGEPSLCCTTAADGGAWCAITPDAGVDAGAGGGGDDHGCCSAGGDPRGALLVVLLTGFACRSRASSRAGGGGSGRGRLRFRPGTGFRRNGA